MKKIPMLLIVLILFILLASTAYAGGKLTVTQETFVVLPLETYYEGIVYAELKNTGDQPVELNFGFLQLFTTGGEAIDSLDLDSYACNPEVLQPGETGFMRAQISVKKATEASYITDYFLGTFGKEDLDSVVTRFPTTAEYKRDTDRATPNDYMIATIRNDTDDTLYDFYIAYALKDAEGKLLYTTVGNYYSVALMAHSSTQIRYRIDDNEAAYMDGNDLIPATVEIIAFRSTPK